MKQKKTPLPRSTIARNQQARIRATLKAKAQAKGWGSYGEFVTAVLKDEAEIPEKYIEQPRGAKYQTDQELPTGV